MSDYIKRINLSFDLRREEHRIAYELLSAQQHKTDYIINTILSLGEVSEKVNRKFIKEALKEALTEINVRFDINNSNRIEEIPEDVFDIFEQM